MWKQIKAFFRPKPMTPDEVANEIRNFIDGKGGAFDWDDFHWMPMENPELEEIRNFCATMDRKYPPRHKNEYCSPEGIQELEEIYQKLKSSP